MAELLVVDDELVTRTMLANALRDAGHSVILASSGVRALQILDDNPTVDMVVTDVIMPMLDGRDFVTTLQRDPRFETIPVLIMSATVGVSEISKLLKAGASRFLAKPIRREALYAEISACLKQPRSQSTSQGDPGRIEKVG